MKVVINGCFGGFNLSPLAVKMIAERKGKQCYFFKYSWLGKKHEEITFKEAQGKLYWVAFSVKNPDEHLREGKDGEIELDSRPDDRADKVLVGVVEEIGRRANGFGTDVKIVEIPDGIDYIIDDYDGLETIREKHRIWS